MTSDINSPTIRRRGVRKLERGGRGEVVVAKANNRSHRRGTVDILYTIVVYFLSVRVYNSRPESGNPRGTSLAVHAAGVLLNISR